MKVPFLRQTLTAFLLVSAAWTAGGSPPQDFLVLSDGAQTVYKINSTGTVNQQTTTGASTFPEGLAFDTGKNLYVALNLTGEIAKVTAGTGVVTAFSQVGSGNTDGIHGLAFDTSGNLYVAEYDVNAIGKINSAGTLSGTPFASFAAGTHPNGIAFDTTGNLWVAESGANKVVEINSAGSTINTFNVGAFPFGLAFDTSGNLYVADQGDNTLDKISGGVVSTLVPAGTLNQPTGVAVAINGDIYVADSGNGHITQVTPSGTATDFTSGFSSPQLMIAAPEPGSAALLGLGIPAIFGMVRKRKRVA